MIFAGFLIIWFGCLAFYLIRQQWCNWQEYKEIKRWSKHK